MIMSTNNNTAELTATKKVLKSVIGFRDQLAKRLGETFGGRRDTYETFGYHKSVTYEDMLSRYMRQDIASRIVNAYPDAIWTRPPSIVKNTDANGSDDDESAKLLSKAFWKLNRRVSLLHYINRADRLAGIGKYAVLLLGFDDVTDSKMLSLPVSKVKKVNLNYVQAYGYGNAVIKEYENDPTSPQFGMPKLYELSVGSGIDSSEKLGKVYVHGSRVLHICDSVFDNEVFGYPILERVFNRLDDAEKIVGGAAEMFWLSGRGGLHFDMDKEVQFTTSDAAKLRDEIDAYLNDLQRVIRTRGVSIKELGGTTINPEPVFNVIMSMISVSTGIPQRIFIGSEQGKLASEQDRANWAIKINERRKLVAEPKILIPLITKLQAVGVLPTADYELQWPEAFQMSPLERAQTAAQQARAATNIARAMSEFAKPIEGVDYPLIVSVTNTEVVDEEKSSPIDNNDNTASDISKTKIAASDNDNELDGEDMIDNEDSKDTINNDKPSMIKKPISITKTKEITIKRRELITVSEARSIIFAQGQLKSEAEIDGVMD